MKVVNLASSWYQSDNTARSDLSEAERLAKNHGITPDRAQMLIDRLGRESKDLAFAAENLRINPR
jgi:hypothetical protein